MVENVNIINVRQFCKPSMLDMLLKTNSRLIVSCLHFMGQFWQWQLSMQAYNPLKWRSWPIFNTCKKSFTSNWMLWLLLYPWLVAFIHHLALAALLARSKSVQNTKFDKVEKLLQVKYCGKSLKILAGSFNHLHPYGAGPHGIFLQSLGNVRTHHIDSGKMPLTVYFIV